MDLHADDFGCVPDGRFLEGVSVTEGSAVLTALGGLRPVDSGKQVAIPGAADLVATIAELVERQEVLGASMAAGSPGLTGTLVDPERPDEPLPFRPNEHVGRRVSVAAAGPAGSTLVSRIAQFEARRREHRGPVPGRHPPTDADLRAQPRSGRRRDAAGRPHHPPGARRRRCRRSRPRRRRSRPGHRTCPCRSGEPNDNQVAGNLGDIYQRVDSAPGARLFVKELDDTAGTGWTAK